MLPRSNCTVLITFPSAGPGLTLVRNSSGAIGRASGWRRPLLANPGLPGWSVLLTLSSGQEPEYRRTSRGAPDR